MPDDPPEESQPFFLIDSQEPEEITEQVARRPVIPLIVLIALIVAGIATLQTAFDDAARTPTTSIPRSVPTTRSEDGVEASRSTQVQVLPAPIEFPPMDVPLVGLAASRPPNVQFWTLDLQDGLATPLVGPDLDEGIMSVRVFGNDRALALLDARRIAVLRIDGDQMVVEQVADVGSRRFLGLDFVADDGRSAWVRPSVANSLLRWDLATGQTVGRWVDLDGDLENPPLPVGIIDGDDLVVRAGVETFALDDDSIVALPIVGTPEAAAGHWVLSSTCADDLRCGRLHLLDTATGNSLDVDRLAQYTSVCGAMAAGPGGDVAIVARRLAVASLLRFGDGDPPPGPVALHIASWGCVDLYGFEVDGGSAWISSSLRGLSVVDPNRDPQLVPLEAIGGLEATGWGPAG